MPFKKYPKLSDFTLNEWIDNRADELDERYPENAPHLRAVNFRKMVGPNPNKPRVDKSNLMRAFDLESRGTIYRWLAKMKREML